MIDHSLTYKRKTFRNIPHILRLRKILRTLKSLVPKRDESYLDIGCSNGYITGVIRSTYCLGVSRGMDHVVENLELARQRYPDIKFEFIDLIKQVFPERVKVEIITCFETLEHVGDLTNAIKNIVVFRDLGSRILISVPIEIGMVGIVKFLFVQYSAFNSFSTRFYIIKK